MAEREEAVPERIGILCGMLEEQVRERLLRSGWIDAQVVLFRGEQYLEAGMPVPEGGGDRSLVRAALLEMVRRAAPDAVATYGSGLGCMEAGKAHQQVLITLETQDTFYVRVLGVGRYGFGVQVSEDSPWRVYHARRDSGTAVLLGYLTWLLPCNTRWRVWEELPVGLALTAATATREDLVAQLRRDGLVALAPEGAGEDVNDEKRESA
jgi:hypothetical protein